MRKFIISDIHGLGNLYYSVMGYLDNISKRDDIELFINGDLIDRGVDSADILIDLLNRIKENKFKITYLAGNHEQLMYEVCNLRRQGKRVPVCNDWYYNGGAITDDLLQYYTTPKELDEVVDTISNLKIYHKFNETIGKKPIVLVHAGCPSNVQDECNIAIKDENKDIIPALWAREGHKYFDYPIGNKDYFSIVGHTPNDSPYGFKYNKEKNYINIDGGAAGYAIGEIKSAHFPLVEIRNDFLKIITFNYNNEIKAGHYLSDGRLFPFFEDELEEERNLLNKELVLRKYKHNIH